MPSTTQTAARSAFAEPWPDGVIARYLTVAGATVDLTHLKTSKDSYTVATCLGCGTTKSSSWAIEVGGAHGYYTVQDWTTGDSAARKWAQPHAESCRALPRPTA